jgi:predicted anti-sigma-YlaC factor YlaD
MNCERIQDLILSDYTDGQLDEINRRRITEHIRNCDACRAFEQVVREKAVQPLRSAPMAEPPAYLWEGVKRKIAAEARPVEILAGAAAALRRGLETLLSIPKPAIAFAVVTMLIIAVLIAKPIADRAAVNDYIKEQVDFMALLDTEDVNGSTALDMNVSTGVESLI